MRYVVAILVVLGLVFSFYYGEKKKGESKSVAQGVVIYGKEELDTLTGNGVFALDGTTVKNNTIITGSLYANNAHFDSLVVVNGQANLADCTLRGPSLFQGLFNATKSAFHAPVTLASHTFIFHDCDIDSIVVKKPSWLSGTQVVVLTDKSICRGTITFEAGRGKVILSPDSKILGKITGAGEAEANQ
jgi:hypothetical protein